MKRILTVLLFAGIFGISYAGGLKVASVFNAGNSYDFTGKIHLGGNYGSGEADYEAEKLFRVTGCTAGATTGIGIELCGNLSNENYITSYNRGGGSYISMYIEGAPLTLNTNGARIVLGGQLLPKSYVSSTMRTTAPDVADILAVNSTAHKLCISSGTGAGAWVAVDDGTTACD